MKGIHSSNQNVTGFLGGHLVHPSARRQDQLSSVFPFRSLSALFWKASNGGDPTTSAGAYLSALLS